jgi:hypothetical protein
MSQIQLASFIINSLLSGDHKMRTEGKIIWLKNNDKFNSWELYRSKSLLDAAEKCACNLEVVDINTLSGGKIREASAIVVDHTDIRRNLIHKYLTADITLIIISGDEEIATKFIGYNVAFADLNIFYLDKYAKKYDLFNNVFLLPEAADYRLNRCIKYEKKRGAIYIGSAYIARVEIIKQVEKVVVYGSTEWQKLCPEKYQGILGEDEYYDEISNYKSSLCLMEGDEFTPHLNAKIFDSIVAGTIPIVPSYRPFTETYHMPSDCYYTYNDKSEINKLIKEIDEISVEEYQNKIKKLRCSQIEFSFDLQYERLLQVLIDIKADTCRTWATFAYWPFSIKIRTQILRKLVHIMKEDQEKMIPISVEFFGIIIPSRLSPIFINFHNRFKIRFPVLTPKKSLLNLPLVKIELYK